MPCISLPTAALIGGGLSAVGGVASAVLGSSAANNAAQVQAQAAAAQRQQSEQMFKTVQGNLQPFQQAGAAALPGLENLLGIGSGGTAGIMAQLSQTPGYQFALNQGLMATQNGFAAQGLGQSGPALKGAANYSEGLAETNYNNIFNQYLQTAGLGGNAAAGLANAAGTFSGQINSSIGQQGAATASGIVGGTNAITGGISSALGGGSNAALLLALNNSGMFGGGGGGGGSNGSLGQSWGMGDNGVIGGF